MQQRLGVRGWTLVGLAGVLLACAGLASDVRGTNLTIDGAGWQVETCESGAVHNFNGIQLTGTDGRRVRLETRPDGTAQVYLLEAGATTGADLGSCATGAFETTGLTVNDIVALQGQATLACDGDTKMMGTVQVDRCATPLF